MGKRKNDGNRLTSSAGAEVAGAADDSTGFSRGATGAGSSIFGGFSSTLGGVLCSSFGFDLKKPPTRADKRRPTLTAFALTSASFSSFFSSFCKPSQTTTKSHAMGVRFTFSVLSSLASSLGASEASATGAASVSLTGSVGASSALGASAAGVVSSFAGSSAAAAGAYEIK